MKPSTISHNFCLTRCHQVKQAFAWMLESQLVVQIDNIC